MFIEIDGAVRDYAFGMIKSTTHMEMVSQEDLQSKILMATIKFGANVGFIRHRFRKASSVDQLFATSKLMNDWSEIFPNQRPPLDAYARLKIELVGSRELYFKTGNFMPVAAMSDWRSFW